MKLSVNEVKNIKTSLKGIEADLDGHTLVKLTEGWIRCIRNLISDWQEMNSGNESVETFAKNLAKKLVSSPPFLNEERELMIARIRDLEKISNNAMHAIDKITNSDSLGSAREDIYNTLFDEKWHKLYKIVRPNGESIGEET